MARYVKYIGTSHYREISQQDWAKQQPPVEQKTLRWDAANGWTLPADRITEDAWPYIDADSELVIIDKDYRAAPESKGDTAPADPAYYPPLTTAAQAEDLDAAAMAAQSEAEHQVDERDSDDDSDADESANRYDDAHAVVDEAQAAEAAQNDLPDQETGSVADVRYTGGSKD